MIAATNSWCIAFDNLSRLAFWFSDSLCRLATGGGFAVREHGPTSRPPPPAPAPPVPRIRLP